MWKQIGCTISRSWLYHQSWPIDCKIYHSFLSYNWSYPLMIGRAICRRTLQLNMRLRTTWAEWLQDLRQLVHYPTSIRVVATGYDRSYVQSCHESSVIRSIARPVVRLRLQQFAKPIAACDQNSVFHQTFTIDCMYFTSTEIARPKKLYDLVWLLLKPNSITRRDLASLRRYVIIFSSSSVHMSVCQ